AIAAGATATRLAGTEVAELRRGLLLPAVLEAHDRIAARRNRGRFGLAIAVTGRRAGRVGRLGRVAHRRQRHLALLVDVVDAHLDLAARVAHVLALLDPLAAAQLRDVHETVAARKDVHERTELGDVHDPALVDGADLGLGRIEDQLDTPARFGYRR